MAQDSTQDDDLDPACGESAAFQQALDWFAHFEGAEPTAAEIRSFRAWYDADPRHRAAYARVEAAWRAPMVAHAARTLDAQSPRREARTRPHIGRRAIAAAAVLLLTVIGFGAAFDLPLRLQADHMTAVGERREIALPDGSKVFLDSASAIRTSGSATGRRVDLLAGRAYFDVATDQARPFRVTAGQAAIEVTGTRFTVARESNGTTVTLREGGLRVFRGAVGGRSQTLAPGQRVRVDATGVADPEPAPAMADSWVAGRLIFRNRPLAAILDEVRRYHAGAILVLDPALAKVRLTGNYQLDDPVRVVEQLANLTSADLFRLSDRLLVLH